MNERMGNKKFVEGTLDFLSNLKTWNFSYIFRNIKETVHCLAKFTFEHEKKLSGLSPFLVGWTLIFCCREMLLDCCSFSLFVCFGSCCFNGYHPFLKRKKKKKSYILKIAISVWEHQQNTPCIWRLKNLQIIEHIVKLKLQIYNMLIF